MVTILPRTTWTSTPDNRDTPLQVSRVDAITVHYPVGQNTLGWGLEKVASGLRAIRQSHLNRGWRDIGYNYAVDQAGRVWHLTGDDVGAHANAVGNTTSIGVVFIVGTSEEPTAELIEAFLEFRAARRIKFTRMNRVQGHKDVPGNSTACPGIPITRLVRSGALTKSPGAGAAAPVSTNRMDPAAYFIGAVGAHVTWFGERLAAHGFGRHYNAGPGPNFTEADRLNTVDFQNAQGWTGGDADGYPGAETLRRLSLDPVTPTPAPPEPTPPAVDPLDPANYGDGATGPHITTYGERVDLWSAALALPSPYSVGPGPNWGPADQAGTREIQVRVFPGASTAPGGGADGLPGRQTLQTLFTDPPEGLVVPYNSGNLAAYDKVKGMADRTHRARTIIAPALLTKNPMWIHTQECSADMVPILDPLLPGYTRVPQGGKGRESWYRTDAGITIYEAVLQNVERMRLKDTKEHLTIAWGCQGFKGVYVNGHNENEGSTFQPLQMRDLMTHGRGMADKHGINRANLVITVDGNFKGAAAFVYAQRWREAGKHLARYKVGEAYQSTNGWVKRLRVALRIDVDVVQRDADILEYEQLTDALVSDHWLRRLVHRLKK